MFGVSLRFSGRTRPLALIGRFLYEGQLGENALVVGVMLAALVHRRVGDVTSSLATGGCRNPIELRLYLVEELLLTLRGYAGYGIFEIFEND